MIGWRKLLQYRMRRVVAVVAAGLAAIGLVVTSPSSYEQIFDTANDASVDGVTVDSNGGADSDSVDGVLASEVLERLEVKGRAPKTGYERTQFYKTWPNVDGCSLRQRIIKRELGDSAKLADDRCTVIAGEFVEPYTGQNLIFYEKADFSKGIQIDHVVALSDAWQKGAQNLTAERRYELATDPLNLLAVDAGANQKKSDGDAATWLPANKSFRCQYVARQVSVKYKYELWVTQAEKDAIARVLQTCPNEKAIGVD